MPYRSAAPGPKKPIRTVVFDYGNVLCHPQQRSDVEKMAKVTGIPTDRFQEIYWKFRVPYDRGDTDGPTYWQIVAAEDNCVLNPRQIEQLIDLDTQGWARQNAATAQWAKKLHEAGLRLGLLSNIPGEISRYLAANCEWVSFFHHLTFSCDVRLVKPDAAIYQRCLNALQAKPEETLFLDDLAPNIEAANHLGIHAVLFDTLENTAARVRERFDLPLPDFLAEDDRVSLPR